MNRRQPRSVRVLFLDHVVRMSGAEQSLADLVAGLRHGPVDPVVALPADGPLAQRLRADGVLVRTVPMSARLLETSRTTLMRAPLVALARIGAFLAAAWRIFRVIREVRPDIVHTNTLKTHVLALLPALVARVPLIWHVRDIIPKGWLRTAMGLLAHLADVVIVPSRAVAEGFRGSRRVYRKLRLVPNGIRVEEFVQARKDRSLREMMGVSKSEPVVGIVGRLAPWKGQDVFLRATAMLAHRFPKAHFAVIGAVLFPENDTEYEQQLHQMVFGLGIEERVSFLGWQPAPEAMAAIDIFVHASSEPEPFGRAIVEAMAAGKPVVATAGGAVKEIVPPAAGFVVPPSRPELLADALGRLLEDPKLRKRMGEAGAATAESFFPVQRTVHSVGQLYRAVAARSARRRGRIIRSIPGLARWQQRARTRPQLEANRAERPIVWPRHRAEQTAREEMPATELVEHDAEIVEIDEAELDPAIEGVEVDLDVDDPEAEEPVDGDDLDAEDDEGGADEAEEIPGPPVPPAAPRAPGPVPAATGRAISVLRRTEDAPTDTPARPAPHPVRPPAPRKRTVAMARPVAVRPVAVRPTAANVATAEVLAPIPGDVPAPRRPVAVPTPEPEAIPSGLPAVAPKPFYDALKRAMDILGSVAVLAVGLPLWILIAIAIKLESPGPVLHRGTVVGKGCRPFTYVKFRSMRIDGDDAAHRKFIERYVRENGGHEHDGEVVYKMMGDSRITAVGRWIRKFSLDEIPQLLNVLRGEMSLVGPRPPLDYEFEHYDERAKQRLAICPGITGMQQVWHRHTASFEEKLALDMKYVRDRSLWLDVKLLLHTIKAALSGH